MYDTLVMLKPNAMFSQDDLHRIITEVTASSGATVERNVGQFRIIAGEASLYIDWNDAEHVIEESDEIAKEYAIPCEGCRARFEMGGDDPDMELFDDYLLINEKLQETGLFVIFDTQECKLLFEDE